MTQQVLRNTGVLLEMTFYADEIRTDADGDVAVTVTRSDGIVDQSGTAAAAGSGRYTYPLNAHEELDKLTVSWSGLFDGLLQTVTSGVEIVGGFYFSLAELRALPGLTDPNRFPVDELAKARTRAEADIERDIGTAFVERYATSTLTGYGEQSLAVRPYVRRVLGVTAAGVALTEEEVAALVPYPTGLIVHPAGYFGLVGGYRDVEVRYIYGWSTEPPADIHDAALEMARQHLLGWRGSLPDAPVDADELGRETVSGEDLDRRRGQSQTAEVVRSWRTRLFGSDELASVQIR
ncbi:MAG: hypothetical protein LC798_05410 [Chloroflexi bacterium]|nr:hypothetical protein [Chloroflexota bacterium]